MQPENTHIDRDTKYDRQIRLWASAGQTRLEQAHICLINATEAGAETLKNLVLPGIGAYTVLDAGKVAADDLSGNFFFEQRHVTAQMSKSHALVEALRELNPDSQGTYIEETLESTVDNREVWREFNAVVVSGHVPQPVLQRLTATLFALNVPLLRIYTSGFYAYLHVISKETTIVDTHDPSKTYDLRIDCPWPELTAYADSFDMAALDDTEHAHVPYIVIFIKALRKWRHDHGGSLPQNYAEKKLFRSEYIEKMARAILVETNFIEAAQAVHRALQVTQIPNSVQDLFARDQISDAHLGPHTSDFWLYVRALKGFVQQNEGKLPLQGNIPDMASTTLRYVQLQTIYREKADRDRAMFVAGLERVYSMAGRLLHEISHAFVATFCKNAAFLYVSDGSKLLYSQGLLGEFKAQNAESAAAHNELAIYFGMLALDCWVDAGKTGRFGDFVLFFESITGISKNDFSQGTSNTLKELFAHNTPSYHNVCSLIGGIAGQEALKICTAQYIPLDNLFVFDGVRSTSSRHKISER